MVEHDREHNGRVLPAMHNRMLVEHNLPMPSHELKLPVTDCLARQSLSCFINIICKIVGYVSNW